MAALLVDGYRRTINYLRVSVTNACDFHCVYCDPQGDSCVLPLESLVRLVKVAALCGITHVRVTGGEPLIRKGIVGFVREIHALEGIKSVSITTNGSRLASVAGEFAGIPVSDINVSLDAVKEPLFRRLSGGVRPDATVRGIDAAVEAGIPVKLNCVPLADCWKEQAEQTYAFAKARGIPVRFIELMPFGPANRLSGVPVAEVSAYLESLYGPSQETGNPGNGPATYRLYDGVVVGTIGPLSRRFCSTCNRVRLLCDGRLKLCLDQNPSVDFSQMLGQSDEELREVMVSAIKEKQKQHAFGRKDENRVALGDIGG